MDITEVILHQHMEQRRMFAMLDELPREDVEGLGAVWHRLVILLETHAEAEERFFYPPLLHVGTGQADAKGVDDEVEDAVKDHNDIRDAITKTQGHEVGTDAWWNAVIECRVSNSNHMAEEERQDLADFRRHASLQQRHDIAVEFLRYESLKAARGVPPRDKDPQEFVEEHSR
jgi:hypothetical protein